MAIVRWVKRTSDRDVIEECGSVAMKYVLGTSSAKALEPQS